MNRMVTKLAGAGVSLVLCLVGTTAWVNAQLGNNAPEPVTDAMLLGDPGVSWLHTNGNLAGHRYSTLTQLNPSNADQLNVAWIFSPGGETDAQNTPLYHDGIVYFAQDNTVFAIDAQSGRRLWKYDYELPESFGGYNVDFITGKHLGLAIHGNHIYFLSNDAKLHAIHYKTGEWKFTEQYLRYPEAFDKTEDGDSSGYVAIIGPTVIPALDDDPYNDSGFGNRLSPHQIIIPLTGTDFGGLPGWVYGVNPEDGEVFWKCSMTPGPAGPDHSNWPGDSAGRGEAGPWSTGSWDPELKMYFTTTGDAHLWNPRTRGDGKLDDLGAASVVACNTDANHATRRYRDVVTPFDPQSFDISQTPMIIEIDDHKVVVLVSRNGCIHYLNMWAGRLPTDAACDDRINWIAGYDVEGRLINRLPLPIDGGDAVEVWPSLFGGVNMYPNAYNPLTGNLYLAATNAGTEYKFEEIKVIGNVRHFGATVESIWGYEVELAIDVKTGAEAWRNQKGKWGGAGGMLTTAGNLVFYTSQAGIFHARDATTGEILYTFNLGVTPKTGPITYMLDGKQYVVQPVGGVPGWGFEEHRLDHGSVVVAFSR